MGAGGYCEILVRGAEGLYLDENLLFVVVEQVDLANTTLVSYKRYLGNSRTLELV